MLVTTMVLWQKIDFPTWLLAVQSSTGLEPGSWKRCRCWELELVHWRVLWAWHFR